MNHLIKNNQQLIEFFNNYKQKMEDFHLVLNDLKNLEEKKLKVVYDIIQEWETYILKKCRLTIKEKIFFEDYEEIFKDKTKKNILCYVYESFLFLGPGLFFGDFALDSEHNRRNATIRAEEETILGWLKSIDYANMIAPKRKVEKYNEIMYLYNNFFFTHINTITFERKYFHLFAPHEFNKNMILFKSEKIPTSLYFMKEGQISVEFKGSIFDIQNLIRKIFKTLIANNYYKNILIKYKNPNYLIRENDMDRIRKYLIEPIFFQLKDKSEKFKEELKKKDKYKLTVLAANEIIGIEEIFLGLPYLCSGKIISEKLICYELSVKQLNDFIDNEKNILTPYVKSSVNKILALIDRLQNIKKSRIFMARLKYDYTLDKSYEQNISEKKISKNKDKINILKKYLNNKRIGNIKSLRKIKSYFDKKNNYKEINKLYELSKDNLNLSIIKNYPIFEKNNKSDNNKKFIQKNFSFTINQFNNKLKNNNCDNLLIGNKCIKINKLKKNIDKNNILNTNNNNNIVILNLCEFSQCRFPLSEKREKLNNNNYNIYEKKETLKLNNNKSKRSKSLSEPKNNTKRIINNKYIFEEKDIFRKKIKQHNKILNIIKKANYNLNLKEKTNIINLGQINQGSYTNRTKIINPKELLPDIIKDYYKEIKEKGCLSFISKRNSNTYLKRKFHDKYFKRKNIKINSNIKIYNSTNLSKIINMQESM